MSINIKHPILVIGAGPAGSSAAFYLAKKSYPVLLVDKHDFPRDKICGDCCSNETNKFLREMGLGNKIDKASFQPISAMLMSSPSGLIYKGNFRNEIQMTIAPRKELDVMIQKHAISSGAKFYKGNVSDLVFEKNKPVGIKMDSGEIILGSAIIAADGANSVIYKNLTTNRIERIHRAVAVRAYVNNIKVLPNTVEYHFHKDILPGYAWIFPIGENCANIGCGASVDIISKYRLNLIHMLQKFVDLSHIRKRFGSTLNIKDIRAWPLNAGSQPNFNRIYDNTILVGDAGAFISPLEGEGIYYALLSGKKAAETIDNAIKKGDTTKEGLQPFENWVNSDIKPKFNSFFNQQKIILAHPKILDWAVRISKLYRPLAKKLMVCGDYL